METPPKSHLKSTKKMYEDEGVGFDLIMRAQKANSRINVNFHQNQYSDDSDEEEEFQGLEVNMHSWMMPDESDDESADTATRDARFANKVFDARNVERADNHPTGIDRVQLLAEPPSEDEFDDDYEADEELRNDPDYIRTYGTYPDMRIQQEANDSEREEETDGELEEERAVPEDPLGNEQEASNLAGADSNDNDILVNESKTSVTATPSGNTWIRPNRRAIQSGRL